MTPRQQFRVKRWKPGDPDAKPRSPAQIAAHRRTWRIVQLRSLWTLACHVRTPWRLWLIRWLIDGELASMKAEPHGVRFRRERVEQEAMWTRLEAEMAKRPPPQYDDLNPIPF